MSKVNILALGGLDEKQKRLYVLEIDSKIFILDSGVYEPLKSDFGIKSFIPNTSYLEQNLDKIKGIFLSGPNRTNIGSLNKILELKKGIPVFGSKTTIESLSVFFKEQSSKWELNIFNSGEEKEIGGVNVSAIEITSILPGTLSYIFKTSDGNVIYLTDYAFDSINEFNKINHIDNFLKLSKEKNLLLISSAINSSDNYCDLSKVRIKGIVEDFIEPDKRLVVSLYENEILNIIELIEIAQQYKRKIFIYSKDFFDLIKIMMVNGEVPEYPIRHMESYDESQYENSIVVLTGTKTKLYKQISVLIDTNNKSDFAFEKEDISFLGALPETGNEHIFASVVNKLNKMNLTVIIPNKEKKGTFSTTEFDVRNYIHFLKPKFFMPVSGFFIKLKKTFDIATQNGIEKENIILADNGEKFSINNGKFEGLIQKEIDVASMINEKIGDVAITNELIEERQALGKDGILTISFGYNKDTKVINSEIDVQMKGLVISKGYEKLIDDVRELILETSDEQAKNNSHINKSIPSLKKAINKMLRDEFKKVPTILFNVVD